MPIIAGRASAAYGAGFAAVTTVPFALVGSYDALGTVTAGVGGVASITFSGIPQNYSHLQVRAFGRSSGAGTQSNLTGVFNGDTSASYTAHYLQGDGATPSGSYAGLADTVFYVGRMTGASSTAGRFGAAVIDILDYANASKNTILRSLSGHDQSGAGELFFWSSLYFKTDPINSITFSYQGSALAQNSEFTLYGVK